MTLHEYKKNTFYLNIWIFYDVSLYPNVYWNNLSIFAPTREKIKICKLLLLFNCFLCFIRQLISHAFTLTALNNLSLNLEKVISHFHWTINAIMSWRLTFKNELDLLRNKVCSYTSQIILKYQILTMTINAIMSWLFDCWTNFCSL
jgi:hypothetical protein